MTMINTQKPPERKQVMIQQKRKWYQHPFVNANIIGAAALAAFLLVAKNCGERPQPQKTQSQTCEVCEKGYRTERLTLPNGYVIKCLKPEPEPPKAQPKDGKKVQTKVATVATNKQEPVCGDGKCEEPENIETCLKDCGYPCGEKRVAKKPDCNSMTNLTGCGRDSVCNKETCLCEKKEEPTNEECSEQGASTIGDEEGATKYAGATTKVSDGVLDAKPALGGADTVKSTLLACPDKSVRAIGAKPRAALEWINKRLKGYKLKNAPAQPEKFNVTTPVE